MRTRHDEHHGSARICVGRDTAHGRYACFLLKGHPIYKTYLRVVSPNEGLLSDATRVEISSYSMSHGLWLSLVSDADSLYHRFFAHPRMVEGLVRSSFRRHWSQS
jgi:hypothetical protein